MFSLPGGGVSAQGIVRLERKRRAKPSRRSIHATYIYAIDCQISIANAMPSPILDPDSIVLIIGGLAILLLCLSVVPSLVTDHRSAHTTVEIPLSDFEEALPEPSSQLLHPDPFRREPSPYTDTSSTQQTPNAQLAPATARSGAATGASHA